MDILLIQQLLYRLVTLGDGEVYSDYFTVLEDTGQVDKYDLINWIHGTMAKPSQAELDAENVIYQDELILIEMISVGLGTFLWEYPTPIDPANPTVEEQTALDTYSADLGKFTVPLGAVLFSEIQFAGDVSSVPVWSEVKTRFEAYKAELAAIKAADDLHLAEYSAMDIDIVLTTLLGNQTEYAKMGDKRWADVQIRSSEIKPSWEEMQVASETITSTAATASSIEVLHTQMNDAIQGAAFVLFQTTDLHAANAFAQSWKLKKENPAEYMTDGILAFKTVGIFTIGEALDTEQKVLEYFTEMVKLLIIFDKFRDTKINEYLVAKAVLEA